MALSIKTDLNEIITLTIDPSKLKDVTEFTVKVDRIWKSRVNLSFEGPMAIAIRREKHGNQKQPPSVSEKSAVSKSSGREAGIDQQVSVET